MTRSGHQGYAVQGADPVAVGAAHDVSRHEGIDVAVGKDDVPCLQAPGLCGFRAGRQSPWHKRGFWLFLRARSPASPRSVPPKPGKSAAVPRLPWHDPSLPGNPCNISIWVDRPEPSAPSMTISFPAEICGVHPGQPFSIKFHRLPLFTRKLRCVAAFTRYRMVLQR